jgi:hypothetical protein
MKSIALSHEWSEGTRQVFRKLGAQFYQDRDGSSPPAENAHLWVFILNQKFGVYFSVHCAVCIAGIGSSPTEIAEVCHKQERDRSLG